jgi:hypothetical protein
VEHGAQAEGAFHLDGNLLRINRVAVVDGIRRAMGLEATIAIASCDAGVLLPASTA